MRVLRGRLDLLELLHWRLSPGKPGHHASKLSIFHVPDTDVQPTGRLPPVLIELPTGEEQVTRKENKELACLWCSVLPDGAVPSNQHAVHSSRQVGAPLRAS